MKLGRKKEDNSPRLDKMASLLATFLRTVQEKWATCMTRWTASLSKRALQVVVFLFCLLFGGASLFTFLDVFRQNAPTLMKPATLTVPKYYKQPGVALTPLLTPQDREYISRFKTHLDSLNSSLGGRAVYDSLLRERPGLLDSLRMIEDVFYSPSK
jgi:hypothetical protein